MQKWQYMTVNPTHQRQMSQDELNEFGVRGWELVAVVFSSGYEDGTPGDGYSYFFKRSISD
jgi:hypothetical protein